MTVYPPKGKNTGAAIVVFPGGGYESLGIDLEGTEVCDWLTLEDAQRTVGLVRFHAAEWHIDPHKVEMHLDAQGGHAFGLRRTKFPVTRWPQLVETWLGTTGMISE
jgi:hypothetical protein